MGSHLNPAVDITYDIGNTSNYFRTVYTQKAIGSGWAIEASTAPSGPLVMGIRVNPVYHAGFYSENYNAADASSTANIYLDTGNCINAGSSGSSGFMRFQTGTPGALGGNSGTFQVITGNAGAGNSGAITLQTGTASGTRGNIVLNANATTFTIANSISFNAPVINFGDGGATNGYINTSMMPNTTLAYDLGSSTYKWLSLHAGTVRAYTHFVLPQYASPPTALAAGEMYYDTTTNKSYTWDGSTWQAHF
jgi:hypothetical protein